MRKSALILILALASPLALANPQARGVDSAPQAKSDDAGLVCTREKSLGSNMARKVCTTAAQREAAREKAQRDVQQAGRCATQEGACVGQL